VDRFDNMRVFAKVWKAAASPVRRSGRHFRQHGQPACEGTRGTVGGALCLTERPARSASPRSARLLRALHAAAGRFEETEQAVSDMHAAPRGELRVMPLRASAYYI